MKKDELIPVGELIRSIEEILRDNEDAIKRARSLRKKKVLKSTVRFLLSVHHHLSELSDLKNNK